MHSGSRFRRIDFYWLIFYYADDSLLLKSSPEHGVEDRLDVDTGRIQDQGVKVAFLDDEREFSTSQDEGVCPMTLDEAVRYP